MKTEEYNAYKNEKERDEALEILAAWHLACDENIIKMTAVGDCATDWLSELKNRTKNFLNKEKTDRAVRNKAQ